MPTTLWAMSGDGRGERLRSPGAGGENQPGQAMETIGQLEQARPADRSPDAGGWAGEELALMQRRLLPAGILRAGGAPLPRLDPQANRASRGMRPERSAGLPAAEGMTP